MSWRLLKRGLLLAPLLVSGCGKLDRCADANGMWDADEQKCYCREGRESSECLDEPYPENELEADEES
jgi:hypothetical protein